MHVTCATVLLVALLSASACVRPARDLVAPSPPPAAQAVPPTAISGTRPAVTLTRAPVATSRQNHTVKPFPSSTSTSTPAPSSAVIAQWFRESQDCWSSPPCVSYAFEIENPSSMPLVADYRVHLQVMNQSALSRDFATIRDIGEIITKWDWVPLTPPGGRTAVAGKIGLPDTGVEVKAVWIELALSDRSTELEAPIPPAELVSLFKTEKGYATTAILTNPWKDTLTEVDLVALAFDDAGEVLGWAYDFTEFVKPGELGVWFDFDLATAPAAVRIYGGAEPAAYSVGFLYRWGSCEPDPEVTGAGFAQGGSELTYVFALENSGSEDMDTQYVVTAYDSEGRVIGVIHYGQLNYLPYGVRYGVVEKMRLATGEVPVARIDVQVRRFGRMGLVPPVPQFDDIRYIAKGSNAGEVVARVTNPDLPVFDLSAVAITSDWQGKINGGGSVVLPDLDPGASAVVRIPVTAAGAVATVELLPKIMDEILFEPDQAITGPALAGAAAR